MKFEKQNLQTVRIGKMRLSYCDPITSNNIVGFVKQEQRLMPLPIVSKLSDSDFGAIIETTCKSWKMNEHLSNALCLASDSRFSHSSDWKEVRYLEKADVSAILHSLGPAIILIFQIDSKMIPEGSIAWSIKQSFSRSTFIPSVELLAVMVNKWLFDPQIIELAECCRVAYRRLCCYDSALRLAVFTMYSALIHKWCTFGLDMKEAQGWVQKN